MEAAQVVVLYKHPLFAEGIASLLRQDSALRVTCIDAQEPQMAEKIRQERPEIVVLEGEDWPPAFMANLPRLVDDKDGILVIGVGLKDNGMDIYFNRRVGLATPDELRGVVASYRANSAFFSAGRQPAP